MNKGFTKEALSIITALSQSTQGEGNINFIARMALLAAMSHETHVSCFVEATHDDMVLDIVEEFLEQGFKVGYKRSGPHTYEIDLSWS